MLVDIAVDMGGDRLQLIGKIMIGAPVALLSTSPEREDTVLVRDPFAD